MIYSNEQLEELRHRWTTVQGKKTLKIIKDSRCYLSPVLFRQKVKNFRGINDEELEDGIDLRGAPLSGFDFRVPIQESDDGFTENIAILSNIHFEGATLKHCNFEDGKIHNCNFENCDLAHAEFKNSTLNNCNFENADCTGINLAGTKIISCNFDNADIKDIVFANTISDEKTTFGARLRSEKEDNFHFASIEYKQIKELYKNSSLHSKADQYHYREMVAKRRSKKLANPMRWISYIFGDLLCKYGTSFSRVLIGCAIVIAGCALLYTHSDNLFFNNEKVSPTFLDSLYFSIVSFTTLGYGDYHGMGYIRFVAALEAFVGATLMSLFTVIVARKMIRD